MLDRSEVGATHAARFISVGVKWNLQGRLQHLLDQQYAAGKAINMASMLKIDAVIASADMRAWLLRGLLSVIPQSAQAPRSFMIDAWSITARRSTSTARQAGRVVRSVVVQMTCAVQQFDAIRRTCCDAVD